MSQNEYGVTTMEIAKELAPKLSAEFGQQEGELRFIQRAHGAFEMRLSGLWICLGSLLRMGLWSVVFAARRSDRLRSLPTCAILSPQVRAQQRRRTCRPEG